MSESGNTEKKTLNHIITECLSSGDRNDVVSLARIVLSSAEKQHFLPHEVLKGLGVMIAYQKKKIKKAKQKYYIDNNPSMSDTDYDMLVYYLSFLQEFVATTKQILQKNLQASLIEESEFKNPFKLSSSIEVGVNLHNSKGSDLLHNFGEGNKPSSEIKTKAEKNDHVLPGEKQHMAHNGSTFPKVVHYQPMLSLGNVFNDEELRDFFKKTNRFLGMDDSFVPEACCELKIDGLSFSALYEQGILKRVATRGNGLIGEDITENARQLDNFPIHLNDAHPPELVEVRGEVYMGKMAFEKINKTLQKPFVNPRNAASGSLRQLDPSITKERHLSYFAYSFGEVKGLNLGLQSDILQKLKEWGFVVNSNHCITRNLSEISECYNKYSTLRQSLDYDADGLVVKINSIELQKRLGRVSNCPRWAVAYKFSNEVATTLVKNIICQVGRTGAVTPVAIVQEVRIGGVVVSRATLHNFDEVAKLDVRIGDKVLIKRSGDVIPKILGVAHTDNRGPLYLQPTTCPSCNTVLIKEKEEDVVFRCPNTDGCRDQRIDTIVHFVSKAGLDIYGLGKKQVEKFFDLGIINSYPDIFRLEKKKSTILMLEGWGDKSFENLVSNINQRRDVSFAKLIYAIGIRHVGEVSAQLLTSYFTTVDHFKDFILSHESTDTKADELLSNIDGIGATTVRSLLEFFSNRRNLDNFIDILNFLSVRSFTPQETSFSGHGKTVVFTGTLVNMTRQEAKERAKLMGFKLLSNISANLDYLVVGNKPGSKLKKASDFGVRILSEEEWLLMSNI